MTGCYSRQCRNLALIGVVLVGMTAMCHATATQFALNGTFLDNSTVSGTFTR